MTEDARLFAPAAARNREPILAIVQQLAPQSGLVLEIASGSGEHVVHIAAAMPRLTFQPSDPDASARASIDAWVKHRALQNVLPALDLDARVSNWPVERADVIISINMVHISPWTAAVGLMAGAGRLLGKGGLLVLYGPFRRNGRHTAPSNAEFDESLRARNPEWGVRDLEALSELATAQGFGPPQIFEMPANNLTVAYRKDNGMPN